MTREEKVASWIAHARTKLQNGGITEADLEALQRAAEGGGTVQRQRLLYLHAVTPSPRAQVVGMALHEPVPGSVTQITVGSHEWPYARVHDAIVDGWQVIHFPDQRAPFDDREIDILGYEFILQKMEEYDVP